MMRSLMGWPALALLFNALVWGLSWWPFRQLQVLGWHPLWTTALMFGLAVAAIAVLRPQAVRGLQNAPCLWLLALGAGLTNVGFNWAVTLGDVLRVVLLFYLMPAWSILLAWALLDERPSRSAWARVALALLGVGLVLGAPAWPWSVPAGLGDGSAFLADALAVMGGFCFALNNVLLRRLRDVPSAQRSLAMFLGGMALAALVGGLGAWLGGWPVPAALDARGWAWMLGLTGAFLLSNLALQFGAARLRAGTTSLIMLSEIVFAAASSAWLGASQLSARVALGGLLIAGAALWAAWQERG